MVHGTIVDIDYEYDVAFIKVENDKNYTPFYFIDNALMDKLDQAYEIDFEYEVSDESGKIYINKITNIKKRPPGFHTADCCGVCARGMPISIKSDMVYCDKYNVQIRETGICEKYKRLEW